MLKISRISRSIITVIYIALMCVILYFACTAQNMLKIKAWQMVVYISALVFSVCFYQVLKRRLNDKVKNNIIIRIYRYVYFGVVLIVSRILMIYCIKDASNIVVNNGDSSIAGWILDFVSNIIQKERYAAVIINTIIIYISSIIIKKIMLNIFENDAVATTSSLIFILSPVSLALCLEYNPNVFNMMFVLCGIYVIMKIFDEIIQYGLKTNAYLYYSIILGACIMLDILFGGAFLTWIIIGIILILVSEYIDSIYFPIPKIEFVQEFCRKKRIKQIAINKGMLILGIICIYVLFAYILSVLMGINTFEFGKINSFDTISKMFSNIKWQYMVGSFVIIFFEIMSVFMRRKSNAKLSIIQMSVVLFGVLALLFTNTSYNLCIYDALLSIGVIISVGNIYYNRTEKIKLLKEKN